MTSATPAPHTSLTVAPAIPGFRHLERLSDDTGLFEHARHAVVRRQHGYCTDDVARGLVVTSREPEPSPEVGRLAECYLAFLTHAQDGSGAFHNRLSHDRRWTDEPGLGDWWGRALWGLGVASVHAPTSGLRSQALAAFRTAAQGRSPHLKATAFAGLGAGEVLLDRPNDKAAQRLLRDVVTAVGPPQPTSGWLWPEPRLTYGNGAVAEALLLAGVLLPAPTVTSHALRLLAFLLRTESRAGHLSVTPAGGRGAGETRVEFDQQPIEVAALADACARAFTVTGDERWRDGVHSAWAWFCGDNDSGTVMYDPVTGAGFDGLERDGANQNQGAESTLAMLSTAQHAQRIDAL